MTIYRFIKDVGPKDWVALPRDFRIGDTVQRYTGMDYGLVSDDAKYAKVATIACSFNGDTFFTVPVEYLVDEAGKQPLSTYIIGPLI